jgi:hypothetical protein
VEHLLIEFRANVKASQEKMEANQKEIVTIRAGQEKMEAAINAIQYTQTELRETISKQVGVLGH